MTHLIWPESAFPFFLTREPDALAQIADLLPPGTVLITGAARAPRTPNADGRITRAYNSVYVIDHDGTILSVYDKVHLVPFGEYLPFQDFLERLGLMQLTKVQGGFIPGDRHRPIAVPGAPRFLPLICYEIIFPGEVVPRGSERPGWLVNLTNDGWFGISPGPISICSRRACARSRKACRWCAPPTPASRWWPIRSGRIVKSLPLGAQGVLDSALPAAVAAPLYTRLGDRHIWLVLALVFLIATVRRRRHGM